MVALTPIYTSLIKYCRENNLRMHMPGHVGRGIFVPELREVASIDVTEVPGVDDLHLSQESIEEARLLLARAFGAKESFFLVNGATSGIHTLFMSLNKGGTKVLIPRNAHRSFFGGMVLSGANPVYIPCKADEELGIFLLAEVKDMLKLLAQNNEAEAVFITSPSYFGIACDIERFSKEAKKQKKLLFVDEAHGSHFSFHSSYPQPALQGGADAVVNSFHKTLPVLNQGACIHIGNGFNRREQLFSAYSLLTTTSPSYPLLASMDLARQFMVERGRELLERALNLSQEYKKKINRLRGLRCYGEDLQNFPGVTGVDPLKLLVSVKGLKIDGFKVSEILRCKYKVQVELQDKNFILAMVSMFHEKKDWEKFYKALAEIAITYAGEKKENSSLELPPYPKVRLTPRDAFMAVKKKVRFEDCVGLVAGEIVTVYPPGIPCVLPGEMIDEEVFSYLKYLKRNNIKLQGPEDHSLNYIKVIE